MCAKPTLYVYITHMIDITWNNSGVHECMGVFLTSVTLQSPRAVVCCVICCFVPRVHSEHTATTHA